MHKLLALILCTSIVGMESPTSSHGEKDDAHIASLLEKKLVCITPESISRNALHNIACESGIKNISLPTIQNILETAQLRITPDAEVSSVSNVASNAATYHTECGKIWGNDGKNTWCSTENSAYPSITNAQSRPTTGYTEIQLNYVRLYRGITNDMLKPIGFFLRGSYAARCCAVRVIGEHTYLAFGSDKKSHCLELIAVSANTGMLARPSVCYDLGKKVGVTELDWSKSDDILAITGTDGKKRLLDTKLIRYAACLTALEK